MRIPVFGMSEKVRHKPGCAAAEDGKRLEIPDLGSRWLKLQRKKPITNHSPLT